MKVLYIWQPNDCLTKVAERFKTTVEKICKVNGITNVDTIKNGQMIIIP